MEILPLTLFTQGPSGVTGGQAPSLAGRSPESCEKCTYKTNEQSDLRRHLLQHDGVKPWACQHCEYKTQQRWILVNHCQKQHNVTLPKRPHTNSMGGPFSRKRMQSKAATIRNIINTQTGGGETTVSAAVRVKQEAGGSGDPTVEIDGEQYTVQLQGSEVSDTEAVMLLANIAQQQPEVISQLQHSSRHFPGHPLGGGGLGQSEDTDIHQSENTTGLSQSEGTSSLSQSEGAIGLSHSQDSVDMDAAAHGIVIDQSIIDQSENPIVIDQSQIIIMEQSHEENLTHSNEAEVIL